MKVNATLPAKRLDRNERGQAMIFFAVLLSTLLMMMGLAIESGRVFVEYRHMQAAADMAALVGAQDLPCNAGGFSCDSVQNEAYWCAYLNYYGQGKVPGNPTAGCTSSGAARSAVSGPLTVTTSVPPVSCSPYDSIDYGNDASNPNCSHTAPVNPNTDFIEVQISQAIHVPIFNVSVNLYTHAIARHGEDSPRDYGMAMLDPAGTDIKLAGTRTHGVIVVGPVISDSTDPNASITDNQTNQVTCDAGWYTAAAEPFSGVSALESGTNAVPVYAPASCQFVNGAADNPTEWHPNWAPVTDPYCTSYSPPLTLPIPSSPSNADWGNCRDGGSDAGSRPTWSNCTACTGLGWAYTWTTNRATGTWFSANNLPVSSGGNWEFFPGIYPGGIHSSTSGSMYFNPGVYTMEGDLQITGQTDACIYGAPACHAGNGLGTVNASNTDLSCSTANFAASNGTGSSSYDVTSSTWYYYCSPWGIWDSYILSHSPNPPAPAQPTFECPSASVGKDCSGASMPLNGVTFYLVNDAKFDVEGSGVVQFAAPNPCPGTGAQSGTSVPFFDPSGAGGLSGLLGSSGGYSYPSGSQAGSDGFSTENTYPSADITLAGECHANNAGNVWPGEFGLTGQGETGTTLPSAATEENTQHLHFLVFARDGRSTIKMAGGSGQNFWGVMYNPGSTSLTVHPGVSGCSSPSSCQITFTGSSGGTGPAMMVGQIIGDNFQYGGTAVMELFYRPCDSQTESCLSGAGSGLVE